MQEKNTDFDKVINRRGTGSLKYDCALKRGYPEDILPLWVADMDFATSGVITDAIIKRAEHGIFGYTEPQQAYFSAVQNWFLSRHGLRLQPDWLVITPGVVFALAMAVRAFTREGDGVLIQPPVYYPFYEVIQDNGRKVVANNLINNGGVYSIDFTDFENKIIQNNVKLFILCSPHNPVGRVWSKEELIRLGDICVKHGVVVVSDEIHCDFVYNGYKHTPFAIADSRFNDITVTCTSPSKTFNLAGLQVANIFIADRNLRLKFKKQVAAAGYSQANTLGLTACQAAYSGGAEWFGGALDYIYGNICYTADFIKSNLPKVRFIKPQGTYLLWLDFSAYGLSDKQLDNIMVKKAGVWLDGGVIFGSCGSGYQRLNAACPRATLQLALNKIKRAFG